MITSVLKKTNYKNIGNRTKAIKAAIQNSEASEIILVKPCLLFLSIVWARYGLQNKNIEVTSVSGVH